MKILATNFLMPVLCKIQNDDNSLSDVLYFIDNVSEKIFDSNFKEIQNTDIIALFLDSGSNLNNEPDEIYLSDLVDREIPNYEDIQKMAFEKTNFDSYLCKLLLGHPTLLVLKALAH